MRAERRTSGPGGSHSCLRPPCVRKVALLTMNAMFKRRGSRHVQASLSTAGGNEPTDEAVSANQNDECRALVFEKLAGGWLNPFVPSVYGWNAIRIYIDDWFDGDPVFQHGGEREPFRIPLEFMAHAGYAIRYLEQQWFRTLMAAPDAVSYTHLTLPTICSV